MFVFEDLLLLDVEAVKEVLAQGGSQDPDGRAQGHQRPVEESLSAGDVASAARKCCGKTWTRSGPIKIKEVEAAQQQIIAVVRQLEAEGVISLKGTVGEQYVV